MATAFKKVTNNAKGALDPATHPAGISSGATSITLLSGEGAEFPGSAQFWVTIFEDDVNVNEIALVTAVSTDTFTITRAQQGTTASAWGALGETVNVQLLWTKSAVEDIHTAINALETTGAVDALAVGGGYGSTGCSITAAGNISTNGTLTVDGASTLTGNVACAGQITVGGGYGSTGCTISSAGNIQANGTLTVDGASTLTGDVTITGASTFAGVPTFNSEVMALNTKSGVTANAAGFTLTGHRGTSAGPVFILQQGGRGSIDAKTIVASGDTVGGWYSAGWDGAAYRICASMLGQVDGTPASGDMPGRIRFQTAADGGTTMGTVLDLLNDKSALFYGALTVGIAGTTRGRIRATRGTSTNTPGVLELASCDGTVYYVFAEDDGTLKIHSALPTANSDGNVVGAQT